MGTIISKDTRRISFDNTVSLNTILIQKSINDHDELTVEDFVEITPRLPDYNDRTDCIKMHNEKQDYWAQRINQLKNEHQEINLIIENEYKKSLEKVNNLFESETIAYDKIQKFKPCLDLQTKLTLIAALADVGYKKTLRKLFLDPTVKFHPEALMRRCERFADEKKVEALEAVAECSKGLRHVDPEEIYNMILNVFQRDDNCQEAVSLWYKMQENEIIPSQRFVKNLYSLCKANNKQIPSDISILLDKQMKNI